MSFFSPALARSTGATLPQAPTSYNGRRLQQVSSLYACMVAAGRDGILALAAGGVLRGVFLPINMAAPLMLEDQSLRAATHNRCEAFHPVRVDTLEVLQLEHKDELHERIMTDISNCTACYFDTLSYTETW
ncbi:hypothetical protein HU200_065886 [Digitaria exilis]|uniref:Uncharacterized protein n=1 Tax=Digitaria exilis TaxID=1010633 RepID=A0A834ZXC9_9POAL|nr:hypothetical protein HU200_065886 [Digitaria exilis]